MRKLYILILLMLTCSGLASASSIAAAEIRYKATMDSLRHELVHAESGADSIRIFYDMYDVAYSRDRFEILERIYRSAIRIGDMSTRLDVLRLIANSAHRNDSLQDVQQRRASLISGTPEQKETMVFIKVARAATAARTLSGEELRNRMHYVLQGYRNDQQVDLYRRIELLFTICKYLEGRSNGDLLFNYLRDLETLINKLPRNPGSLRSLYYTAAAIANTEAGRHAQAIEADSHLLDVIAEFEEKYRARGREFCNYTNNYYVVYRRMLSNYEALTDNEVDSLYTCIYKLADNSPDIQDDFIESGHVVDAYYLMAKGHYAQALPMLLKASRLQVNVTRRKSLLQQAIVAATNCGDDAQLLEAYKEYLPLIEKQYSNSEEDRMLEYQVLYDVNALEASNADLEAQYSREELREHNRMLIYGLVAIVLLLATIGILYYAYHRTKRMARHLEETNQTLSNERDNLRRIQKELIQARDKAKQAEQHKSDFVNSISHEISEPVEAIVGYSQLIVDSIEDNRRGVLDRFVQIIQLNAQLLRTLVNDVLDIAELDNSRVVIKFQNISLREICEVSVESIRSRVKEGVELSVRPIRDACLGCVIDTDPMRAEQVIINLLTNAAKFTDKGHISVIYGMDMATNTAKIIVEDTGCGVPKGKEKKIFERFYKGSQVSQGIGLGLSVCQLVSRLLGGSVTLDTTYTDGARFIFTLPINNVDRAAHTVPV